MYSKEFSKQATVQLWRMQICLVTRIVELIMSQLIIN